MLDALSATKKYIGAEFRRALTDRFPMPQVTVSQRSLFVDRAVRVRPLGKLLRVERRAVYTGQTPFYPCGLREQELPVGMPSRCHD